MKGRAKLPLPNLIVLGDKIKGLMANKYGDQQHAECERQTRTSSLIEVQNLKLKGRKSRDDEQLPIHLIRSAMLTDVWSNFGKL